MEKLLFTGGTGFLGRNAMPVLTKQYEVTRIGISKDDDIKVNFALEVPKLPCRYDVVLHAAGKAHIYPKTEEEKKSFYDVNVTGTKNLCSALNIYGLPKTLIFISTLGVYGNKPGNGETEDERELVGDEVYQETKIQAEQYLQKWAKENGVILGILRPSLLVGKGAPGNLGAMVNGIKTGFYASIAGGKAHKSMLMAEDIAHILPLIENKGGIYNVCDNHHPRFRELERTIAKQLGKRPPLIIPYWMAKCLAWVGDVISTFPINSSRLEKIITDDTYSSKKAQKELGWTPMDVIENYKI
ncbi:MAG: NAD(P)-dependent oxidoreductase [Bacteroides heparinolyticus]|nr:NAD(P)-dependent oxidoreductase [Bacteroides heparinolyticus]